MSYEAPQIVKAGFEEGMLALFLALAAAATVAVNTSRRPRSPDEMRKNLEADSGKPKD